MSEYERILEFAEKRLQEKSTRGDVLTIRYWVGVIDGIKGLKRLCEKDIPKTVTVPSQQKWTQNSLKKRNES